TICEGSTNLYYIDNPTTATDFYWSFPTGWTGINRFDSLDLTTDDASGILELSVINFCGASDTISLNITVNPAPIPQINRNGNILETTLSFSSYQWNKDGAAITNEIGSTFIINDNGSYSVT